jgi:hypothetical protein
MMPGSPDKMPERLAPDDYEEIWGPPSLWTRIVRAHCACRTPPAPSLEEARARLAAAKPFYTEVQKEALDGIEDENFGNMRRQG